MRIRGSGLQSKEEGISHTIRVLSGVCLEGRERINFLGYFQFQLPSVKRIKENFKTHTRANSIIQRLRDLEIECAYFLCLIYPSKCFYYAFIISMYLFIVYLSHYTLGAMKMNYKYLVTLNPQCLAYWHVVGTQSCVLNK